VQDGVVAAILATLAFLPALARNGVNLGEPPTRPGAPSH
jgi:hypothetical protein